MNRRIRIGADPGRIIHEGGFIVGGEATTAAVNIFGCTQVSIIGGNTGIAVAHNDVIEKYMTACVMSDFDTPS